jgi:uncharacterized protein
MKRFLECQRAAKVAIEIINLGGDNRLAAEVMMSQIRFRMYYALQLYFNNGGDACYINSISSYPSDITDSTTLLQQMSRGLDAIKVQDEPTIILFPDAPLLAEKDFYQLYRDALKQCSELMDRVVIVDVHALVPKHFLLYQICLGLVLVMII